MLAQEYRKDLASYRCAEANSEYWNTYNFIMEQCCDILLIISPPRLTFLTNMWIFCYNSYLWQRREKHLLFVEVEPNKQWVLYQQWVDIRNAEAFTITEIQETSLK